MTLSRAAHRAGRIAAITPRTTEAIATAITIGPGKWKVIPGVDR
jgi:hypothetical protein